ncbi:hypothetical protein DRQ36_05310 [bacterium]|nr:MAG: hypothetical protein DRQ36_05310 [bacterium]
MSIRRFFVLFSIILLLVLIGCGTTAIRVPIVKPAEINLKGIEKIAVGEISGFMGLDFADELTTALFNTERYEVLDRQNLNSILSEQGLTWTGIANPKESAKLGDIIGAAALVVGRVSDHSYNEEVTYDDRKRKDGTNYRIYWRKGLAKLVINLKVIDVQTGRILATKQFEAGYSAQTTATNSKPAEIDKTSLYRGCREDIVKQFVKMIAPYTVYVKMSFLSDGDIPDLQMGVNMAKVGNWDNAISYFQRAVKENPGSWKAHYDLGMAYECTGDYEIAIERLTTAYSLNPKNSIQTEIAYCRQRIEEQRRLMEQLGE